MAKNIWAYAYLPENERLKLIKAGNSDVFQKEMQRTDYLIEQYKNAGLDTKNLENQKQVYANAYASIEAPDTHSESGNIQESKDTDSMRPRFARIPTGTTEADKLNRKHAQYDIDSAALVKGAQNSIKDLKEFYANNGFSVDSDGYRKSLEEIKKHYTDELSMLYGVAAKQVGKAQRNMKDVFYAEKMK